MARDAHPLQIFSTHQSLARRGEGPRDVSVFAGDQFLFASFDHGREQVLDVRAHDRMAMLVIYLDWIHATPEERTVHPPVPADPASPSRERPRLRAPAPLEVAATRP